MPHQKDLLSLDLRWLRPPRTRADLFVLRARPSRRPIPVAIGARRITASR
jgi:hypothetical protein